MWGCVINIYLEVHYEGLFYWNKNELMESWYKKKNRKRIIKVYVSMKTIKQSKKYMFIRCSSNIRNTLA